jgi:hypothetical protein
MVLDGKYPDKIWGEGLNGKRPLINNLWGCLRCLFLTVCRYISVNK